MSTIKKSHLKEIFKKYGLSEGIFDIFDRKRKKLEKELDDIRKEIDDVINSAPSDFEKKKLQNLAAAFDKVKAAQRAMK